MHLRRSTAQRPARGCRDRGTRTAPRRRSPPTFLNVERHPCARPSKASSAPRCAAWRGAPGRARVLGRQELGVDEGGELADLHRRALHAAERGDHPLGGLEMPALERIGGLLGRAGQVGGARAGVAGALRAYHRADLRGPADSALRESSCRRLSPRPSEDRTAATLAGRMADRPTLEVDERPERGTRATRRLRRDGLVPGRRLRRHGTGGRHVLQGERARPAPRARRRPAPDRPQGRGGRRSRWSSRRGSSTPSATRCIHIDLLEVRLDEKIQTPGRVQIEGVEEAPGVKEGGVLEQISHAAQRRGAADGDPRCDRARRSARWRSTATITSPRSPRPRASSCSTTSRRRSSPRSSSRPRSRSPEEIEEETELVGEDGEPLEGAEEGEEAAEGAGRGRRGRGVREPLPSRRRRRRRSTGWSSGSGTRATATRARATTSASRWPTLAAERWGLPTREEALGGPLHRRPHRPGRPARGACCCRRPT